ncbi:hypothetical protein BJY24_004124 [Nocardia transvalensis]|uniref:Uncharacterized protein n=1 Tax=Nocardia transvalensis TaxID=37333 RepID=A0A7W9UJH1_9NOCA|nr:hypothetical protein [Nocardia transvalensis]
MPASTECVIPQQNSEPCLAEYGGRVPAIIDKKHAVRILINHAGHGGTGVCEAYLAAAAYLTADDEELA